MYYTHHHKLKKRKPRIWNNPENKQKKQNNWNYMCKPNKVKGNWRRRKSTLWHGFRETGCLYCIVLCCCFRLRMVKSGGGVWREKRSKPACVAEAVEPKLNKWINSRFSRSQLFLFGVSSNPPPLRNWPNPTLPLGPG